MGEGEAMWSLGAVAVDIGDRREAMGGGGVVREARGGDGRPKEL